MYPQLITKLFEPCVTSVTGMYKIQLFWNNKWTDVIIDDYIPFQQLEKETTLSAKSKNNNEMWVALLEKAYVKLHGSYEVSVHLNYNTYSSIGY